MRNVTRYPCETRTLAAAPRRQSLDHLGRHVGDLEAAIDLYAQGDNRTAGVRAVGGERA